MTIKTVPVGPYTFHVDVDGYFGELFIQNGLNYEWHIRNEFERIIPGCSGFLDLGANIGLHVLSAKVIDPKVSVCAFEPSAENVSVLCQNVALNKLERVRIFPVAASNEHGFIWLNSDVENSQPSSTANPNYPRIWPSFPVGDLVELGEVDVFKVDIEGFELMAWNGMRHFFEHKHKPIMVFELSFPCLKNTGVDPLDELRWLESFGYTFTVLENKPGMRKGPMKAQSVINHILGFGEQVADILAESKGTLQ